MGGPGTRSDDFQARNITAARAMAADGELRRRTIEWLAASAAYEYSYHFSWLGLPIIQYPPDIVAVQEVLWNVRPDLVIETGIARGGSLVLSASILELVGGDGLVVGIDIDIRQANRKAIEAHPLARRIRMIEGSSVSDDVISSVRRIAENSERVVVLLDASHTHDHVLRELEAYSPLVRPGGYIIVFDTIIEDLPAGSFPDRPWDRGNNPATAVREFLTTNDRFVVDRDIEDKLLISVAPGGYLKCVRP